MVVKKGMKTFLFVLFLIALIGLIFISGFLSSKRLEERRLVPADSPEIPERRFFMGVLPVPGNDQSFEEAYHQASLYAEFSPVWGNLRLSTVLRMTCPGVRDENS